MDDSEVREIVKTAYGKIARSGCCCGCSGEDNKGFARSIGYSEKELASIPVESNLGLSCGNPTALAGLREGEVMLDLGSGAGFDCFLASKKVGARGKVIGVDMTPEMVERAQLNAKKGGYSNVEFRLGGIEELPVEDGSIDVVISNCVINLAPDKEKVFSEAFRVLKENGRMFVSDIVLLGELSEEQKNDSELIAGCVGGAIQRDDYLGKIKDAGFKVRVLGEDKGISKRQYDGIPLESLKVEAHKPPCPCATL